MRRWLWLGLALCLLCASVSPGIRQAQAQTVQVCTPTRTLINTIGNGLDIPVSTTPVDVLTINAAACTRLLWNKGLAPIRCLSKAQGTPTINVGLLLNAGEQVLMGTEGREAWWCVRSSGADTIVVTIEGIP